MKKLFNKIKETFCNKKAEGFVDSGVKVLIAVVIGALFLAGLYSIFSYDILPMLQSKIYDLFNYVG